jgi:N-glycosylase/DNA lyase
MKHYFKIESGQIIYYNYESFLNAAQNGEWLEIGKTKKNRSLNQNRYYHGVVVKYIAKEMEQGADLTHEQLKFKFLQFEGILCNYVKSTKTLSTVEFEEYISEIRRWAFDFFPLDIPTPNDAGLYYDVNGF